MDGRGRGVVTTYAVDEKGLWPNMVRVGSRVYSGPADLGFTPARRVSFDGLVHGADVSASGIEDKRFDYYGAYGDGYGSRAVTTDGYNGASSCCEMTIKAGMTGRRGDGQPGTMGDFGGGFTFPVSTFVKNEPFWLGVRVKPVGNVDWSTDTGSLKFLRVGQTNLAQDLHGKMEFQIKSPTEDGIQDGWMMNNEVSAISQENSRIDSDRLIVNDQWNWVEIYINPSDVPSECVGRIWVGDQLVCERTGGNHNKWYENGDWNESDFLFSETQKWLVDEAHFINGLMLFTYWNDGAASDEIVRLQEVVVHDNPVDLTAVDEFGNKMIGSTANFI